jgi:uncharacterized membrane protein (UPF0136 family)
MGWLNLVLGIYAVALLAGGVMGYQKAGSSISLIVSACASILVVIGILLSKSNSSVGYGICGLVAACLAGFFAYRVMNGSVMPGIPALGLSVVVLVCLIAAHFASKTR